MAVSSRFNFVLAKDKNFLFVGAFQKWNGGEIPKLTITSCDWRIARKFSEPRRQTGNSQWLDGPAAGDRMQERTPLAGVPHVVMMPDPANCAAKFPSAQYRRCQALLRRGSTRSPNTLFQLFRMSRRSASVIVSLQALTTLFSLFRLSFFLLFTVFAPNSVCVSLS